MPAASARSTPAQLAARAGYSDGVVTRHPHAQLICEFHDHQNRFYAGGQQAPVARMLAVDVTWHVPGVSSLAGEYRGRDEVLRYFARRRQLADATFRIDVRGVLAEDERTVIRYGRGGTERRVGPSNSRGALSELREA